MTIAGGIRALVGDLERELARDARGRGVAGLLGRYAGEHADWRDYALFDAAHYTRNLVERNARYELMVVCWGLGQESPIHNHAGQSCWMAVHEGELEEQHYRPRANGAPGLELGQRRVFRPGEIAYIDDEIALHRVRPLPGGTGVSLHLYACPIDACNVYDPVSGAVVRRALAYHSVRGVLA
jgi:cysteine dioxygenase